MDTFGYPCDGSSNGGKQRSSRSLTASTTVKLHMATSRRVANSGRAPLHETNMLPSPFPACNVAIRCSQRLWAAGFGRLTLVRASAKERANTAVYRKVLLLAPMYIDQKNKRCVFMNRLERAYTSTSYHHAVRVSCTVTPTWYVTLHVVHTRYPQ